MIKLRFEATESGAVLPNDEFPDGEVGSTFGTSVLLYKFGK